MIRSNQRVLIGLIVFLAVTTMAISPGATQSDTVEYCREEYEYQSQVYRVAEYWRYLRASDRVQDIYAVDNTLPGNSTDTNPICRRAFVEPQREAAYFQNGTDALILPVSNWDSDGRTKGLTDTGCFQALETGVSTSETTNTNGLGISISKTSPSYNLNAVPLDLHMPADLLLAPNLVKQLPQMSTSWLPLNPIRERGYSFEIPYTNLAIPLSFADNVMSDDKAQAIIAYYTSGEMADWQVSENETRINHPIADMLELTLINRNTSRRLTLQFSVLGYRNVLQVRATIPQEDVPLDLSQQGAIGGSLAGSSISTTQKSALVDGWHTLQSAILGEGLYEVYVQNSLEHPNVFRYLELETLSQQTESSTNFRVSRNEIVYQEQCDAGAFVPSWIKSQ
jgi:hypothetical protein